MWPSNQPLEDMFSHAANVGERLSSERDAEAWEKGESYIAKTAGYAFLPPLVLLGLGPALSYRH